MRRRGREPRAVPAITGFFYHFLDMQTGTRADENVELSSVDTALLDRGRAVLPELVQRQRRARERDPRACRRALRARRLALDADARAVDLAWAGTRNSGFIDTTGRATTRRRSCTCWRWDHPRNAVEPDAWSAWTQHVRAQLGHLPRQQYLAFAPLFGHQYTHVLGRLPRHARRVHAPTRTRLFREQPPRDASAARVRDRQSDGLERLRRRHLGPHAPATVRPTSSGTTMASRAGSAAMPAAAPGCAEHFDDGTIAPTAVASSLPFAPEIVIPATLQVMLQRYRRAHLLQVRVPRFVQPQLRLRDVPLKHRPAHCRLGLGRYRLHRHRPGTDPRDDRQLP